MSQSTPLKVSLYGFDDRSTGRMKILFKVSLRQMFEVSQNAPTSIQLVDIDHCDFESIEALRKEFCPDRTVLITSELRRIDPFCVLKKPVKLNLLKEALTEASKGSSSKNRDKADSHTVEKSSAPSASLTESAFFDPNQHLLGWLSKWLHHCDEKKHLHITTWRGRTITAFPHHDVIYTDIGPRELRNLALVPRIQQLHDGTNVELKSGAPEVHALESLKKYRLSHFIASLALTTANGRLPAGTQLSAPHYLECWPNFTRLPSIPHGLRIAATWHGEPQSLASLYSRLSISQEDINNFFSVAMALRLCGLSKRASDMIVQKATPEPSRPRHILQSLLGHLARKTDLASRVSSSQGVQRI